MMDAHSSLLTAISHRPYSISSSHLNLGLLLLPSGLLSYFLNSPSLIHSYCMSTHSSLFVLIFTIVPRSLYSSLNSWLVHIHHIPCSTNGPYTLLHIFLSHIPSLVISITAIATVPLPNTTAGFTIVLYILILTALLMALDLNIFLRALQSCTKLDTICVSPVLKTEHC